MLVMSVYLDLSGMANASDDSAGCGVDVGGSDAGQVNHRRGLQVGGHATMLSNYYANSANPRSIFARSSRASIGWCGV